MKRQLLLLEDVIGLGRKGELVSARAGFIRNFLIPQQKAVIADPHTLKLRERLVAERAKQAAVDRKISEELAQKLVKEKLVIEVKVDHDGKMYGSVTALEIARQMKERGFALEKQNIGITQPLKYLGIHKVPLRLPEGVMANLEVELLSEKRNMAEPVKAEAVESVPEAVEEPAKESTAEAKPFKKSKKG